MSEPVFFRAYDIRGVVGKELKLEDFLNFGRALGVVTDGKVVVGRDARVHGEMCEMALTSGLLESGVEVELIGVTPIGMLSFAVEEREASKGVMVGASHNPPEYNGLKFFERGGEYSKELDNTVRKIFLEKSFKDFEWKRIGKVYKVDVKSDYISFIASKITLERGVSVAVDTMNATGGVIVRKVFQRLGLNPIILNEEVNGFFPKGAPEPKPSKLTELRETVVSKGLELGLAFDGDCDRVMLIDDRGRFVSPEKTAAYLLYNMEVKKGDIVVTTVNSSLLIDEVAEDLGLKVVRTRVGHFYIIGEVKKLNAVIGFERSGHMTIPSLRLFDDAILVASKILEIKSRTGRLSEFIDKLPKYFNEEVNVKCSDKIKFRVVEEVKNLVSSEYSIETIDGVRAITSEGWFLVRASNTEPLVRITAEAKTGEKLNELLEYAKKLVIKAMNSLKA